jgi:hypothetical protein
VQEQFAKKRAPVEMSGRPRTTSFAEGNKQSPNPPLGGMKISSKWSYSARASIGCDVGLGLMLVLFNMAA